MLDWFLKNPQILIIVVFGVIALVGNIAKARQEARKKQARGNRPLQPGQPPRAFDTARMDADEAERTRRVQEELRRKILARMQRTEPENSTRAPMPRPAMHPVARGTESTPPPLPAARTPQLPPAFDESVSAYQSASDKLAELEAIARSAPAHQDEAFAIKSETTETASVSANAAFNLGAILRDPHELRRAFVLREILDAPVSLRPRPGASS